MTSETVVELSEVTKSFGLVQAVAGVSASIPAGRLIGLVGPDGAGKTTLMRIMAGLMLPTSGRAVVVGYDSAGDNESLADEIGYMPQQFGLYEDLTVQENLQLYADLRGVAKKKQPDTFAALLRLTRLAKFTGRLAGRLSGGMKQKLGLACALMARPKLLLLDEPSVGVDPVSRQDLWAMVEDLLKGGMTVVWATSYLDEAERCSSVFLLSEGKVLYSGAPKKLSDRLKGRSFLLRGIVAQRRKLLADLMEQTFISDAVVHGESIRVVIHEGRSPEELAKLATSLGGKIGAVPPRFEDAFIDLLGGSSSRRSRIAEKMPEVTGSETNIIACDHLTKKFGNFIATDNVSFSVGRGEIFGLLGPNGAGKSTTFKMLCGLLSITEGSATVVGHELLNASKKAKLSLGYMAQKFSLYGLLSVKQNLEFFAGVYGLSGKVKKERITEVIEAFSLGPFLNSDPAKLSLGYRQRLALACAIMHRPPVLFLDEPTSGVDPLSRREFWSHINGFVSKGMTVMVTTHFMEEAEYCDRIGLMYASKLIALDTPDALKKGAQQGPEEPTMEEAFIHLIKQQEEQQI
jgi:ABC-2 type transport system ATP-binding protein